MVMNQRQFNTANYRYGFNGKENDNEVKGVGNQQDYGARIYDGRLGKFLSVDPLSKNFAFYTPYSYAGNKPIWAKDLDGKEEWFYWNDLFGWTKSVVLGPMEPNVMNNNGYYLQNQLPEVKAQWDMQKAQIKKQELANESQRWGQIARDQEKFQNPIYLLCRFGTPFWAINDIKENIDNDEYGWATFNTVLAFLEVKQLTSVVKSARIADIFDMAPKQRGVALEKYLATWGYGPDFLHTAEISPYFKAIDFYDRSKALGISLKTVNAKYNFSFDNIKKNIRDLAEAKGIGAISSHGGELPIKEVRLDIIVPKGYDVKVLDNIKAYAESYKVPIKITEIE